jgi:hypothetical protein
MLTLEEYEKLVNFRKKYLKEHLNKLLDNINKSQNTIEAQKKTIFRNAGEMNSLRQEAEYYAQYEKLIEFDREFRNQKEQDEHFKNMVKFVSDEKTRLSLERSYYKKTYSFDVLMGKVNKAVQENTRMSFRQTIGDILKSATHITKKGKEYGQVLYEDSGLFRELKRISKLSVKKAKEELSKLDQDRKNGINKDNLRDYTIKRELLYFYSKEDMDAQNMNEIVKHLGDLRMESYVMLNEIKKQNLLDEFEIIDGINKTILDNKILGDGGAKKVLRRIIEMLFINEHGTLEDVVEYITDSKLARKLSLTDNEINYKVAVAKQNKKLMDRIQNEVLSLYARNKNMPIPTTEKSWTKLFKQWTEDWNTAIAKLSPTNSAGDKMPPHEINMYSLIDVELQRRNPQTAELIKKYYKDDMNTIDELLQNLPEEALTMADLLFETAQDRDRLTPYYVMVFNRDMGEVENYFPRTSYHDEIPDFFNLNLNKDINKVSAIEHRSKDAIPKFANALTKTLNHIKQTEYVINMAPKVKSMTQLFNNTLTRNIIEDKFGKKVMDNLLKHIESLQLKHFREYESEMDDIYTHLLLLPYIFLST